MATPNNNEKGDSCPRTGKVNRLTVDMSTRVSGAVEGIDSAQTRREQWRASQARRRKALKDSGAVHLQIVLVGVQAETFRKAQDMQGGPVETFALRALLTGAKFLANSGNQKGGKARIKREAK